MEDKKLKVLILAEAANPDWTSVPLVGWSHSLALSKVCDAHLVTQIRNKNAITDYGWTDGCEFTAVDTENLLRPAHKFSKLLRGGANLSWTIATAIQSIAYPYFEYKVWKTFKTRLKAGEFDVVHRITPVSPTAPSYIAKKLKKTGIPFVVGPINGGVEWPKEFSSVQKKEKEWLNRVRGAYKILPGYTSLRKNASAILCGSMATLEQLPQYCRDRSLYLAENAIDPNRFSKVNNSDYTLPLKAAFVGRLVPYKGADMAIEAIAHLAESGKMTFDIYGSGPEEAKLKNIVDRKGLGNAIKLHGFVKNEKLQDELVSADLFVFPSVREFGGGVVLEAMALGVVPVIVDYAGPSELLTDESGYLIPLCPREEMIKRFSAQLEEICQDPASLVEKRKTCLARIDKYYTWSRKAEQMQNIYKWVLGKADKPDYEKPFL